MSAFTDREKGDFQRNGYVLIRGLAEAKTVEDMLAITNRHTAERPEPAEYEAGLGYPGAPSDPDAPGGRTIRRLLRAYDRDDVFRAWARRPDILARLREIMGPDIALTRAHHNCIMVKDPSFSSDTGWHQDIRYWRFERPELVSVLLALSDANSRNGCLRFIPGSHLPDYERERFDDAVFLREELPENRELLGNIAEVEMSPGDAVFFHCRVLHSALRNRSEAARVSVIFTYHSLDNRPLSGTRSASLPEVDL